MNIQNKHVGQFIRKRRIELNLTQAELSKKLGWARYNCQQLSNIECQKNGMPPKSITKMALALNVSPEMITELMVKDFRDSIYNECQKQLVAHCVIGVNDFQIGVRV